MITEKIRVYRYTHPEMIDLIQRQYGESMTTHLADTINVWIHQGGGAAIYRRTGGPPCVQPVIDIFSFGIVTSVLISTPNPERLPVLLNDESFPGLAGFYQLAGIYTGPKLLSYHK